MTDLERFFDRLVRNLVATDAARLRRPVPILEIKTTLVPYRSNRRALGLETSDEYEELLIRLVAEEGGLVTTNPPDVAEWCQRQMASLSPDLSGIPGQSNATVTVRPEAVARVLGAVSAEAIAKNIDASAGAAVPVAPEKCIHCDAKLPGSRAVNFCPSCGRSVTMIPCDNCGADMEPGWRFCVNCGQEATDTGSSPA
ncbi:MAG TPA: zinc ribbon domain-containing protein [Gemmatimonadales bacterium]